MAETLRAVLNELPSIPVGAAVWARGLVYQRDRRVETVIEEGERVEATVRGSIPYQVTLWLDAGHLRWECSCPFAEDGSFCKHA